MSILPDLPAELPAEPAAILQSMIPDRVIPTIFPRLSAYAARITVKTHEFIGTLPDGTTFTVSAATLIPKLVASMESPEGDLHEVYLLMREGDPEGVLELMIGPTVAENLVGGGISRMCAAQLDIYIDDVLVKSFPAESEMGHYLFSIPK